MAKVWDHYEWTIGTHFIVALLYGDNSALSKKEDRLFDAWEKSALALLPDGCKAWALREVDGTNDEFAQCDITGLWGDVMKVRLEFECKD